MKETNKSLVGELVTNSISRNLIIIFLGGLLAAVALVTVSIMLLVDKA